MNIRAFYRKASTTALLFAVALIGVFLSSQPSTDSVASSPAFFCATHTDIENDLDIDGAALASDFYNPFNRLDFNACIITRFTIKSQGNGRSKGPHHQLALAAHLIGHWLLGPPA